jgi:hypothetical protein
MAVNIKQALQKPRPIAALVPHFLFTGKTLGNRVQGGLYKLPPRTSKFGNAGVGCEKEARVYSSGTRAIGKLRWKIRKGMRFGSQLKRVTNDKGEEK